MSAPGSAVESDVGSVGDELSSANRQILQLQEQLDDERRRSAALATQLAESASKFESSLSLAEQDHSEAYMQLQRRIQTLSSEKSQAQAQLEAEQLKSEKLGRRIDELQRQLHEYRHTVCGC